MYRSNVFQFIFESPRISPRARVSSEAYPRVPADDEWGRDPPLPLVVLPAGFYRARDPVVPEEGRLVVEPHHRPPADREGVLLKVPLPADDRCDVAELGLEGYLDEVDPLHPAEPLAKPVTLLPPERRSLVADDPLRPPRGGVEVELPDRLPDPAGVVLGQERVARRRIGESTLLSRRRPSPRAL